MVLVLVVMVVGWPHQTALLHLREKKKPPHRVLACLCSGFLFIKQGSIPKVLVAFCEMGSSGLFWIGFYFACA